MIQTPVLSLLWPEDNTPARSVLNLDEGAWKDLEIDAVLHALCPDFKTRESMRAVFRNPAFDPAVILYRQKIMQDFWSCPALAEALEKLLPVLDGLTGTIGADQSRSPLYEALTRLSELEALVQFTDDLGAAFAGVENQLQSDALKKLAQQVALMAADGDFQRLKTGLPDLMKDVRGIRSISIGINLDGQYRPVEAVLEGVYSEKIIDRASSLLGRITGQGKTRMGLTSLHSLPRKEISTSLGLIGLDPETAGYAGYLTPLFEDLSGLMKKTAVPVVKALKSYGGIETAFLRRLRPELQFYLTAVSFFRRIQQAGLPLVMADILPVQNRTVAADDFYNLYLALQGLEKQPAPPIITNGLRMDDSGRLQILTGPNQGGKTVYTQGCGLLQYFFQLGLFVPARKAAVSPCDAIFTHYQIEEKPTSQLGRFGEEAQRLSRIFDLVTERSLVLMNESFSSTSSGESLYVAQDVLKALCRTGCRGIFATHMHELAARADELNADGARSLAVSMVSVVEESCGEGQGVRRTYRVIKAPPRGHSYARELARNHGIGYDQILEKLNKRQVAL